MKLTGWIVVMVIGITLPGSATGQEGDSREGQQSPAVGAAWQVLDRSRSDKDERHRQQAVLAGGVMGSSGEAVRFVAGALQDKSPLVRQTAVTVLGDMKTPEALTYLRHAMEDTAEVSFTAARVLCNRGEQDGCEFLQQVLAGNRKDPKPGFVQKNLKYAKKKLTPEELALMGVREASGVILGPAAIGIVVGEEALKAETSGTGKEDSGRAIAAVVMADHPDNYTRILLEWALSDPHVEVRAAAAKGLAKCGSTESIPKLQGALNDSHVAVRCMAAAAVISLSGK